MPTNRICAVLGFFMALTGLPAFGQTNLAPNPGFELPDFAGYLIQAKAVLDEDNPHGGRVSVRQEAVPGHAWNCMQMSTGVIPVHDGMVYRLSAFTRNSLTNGQAFLGLREMNKAGDSIRFRWQSVPNGEASWREHALQLRPVVGTTALQIYFRIATESSGGSVWWDDVCLVELPDIQRVTTPPLLNIAPLETLVLAREQERTHPATLLIRMEVGPDGQGGALALSLRPESSGGETIWSRETRLDVPGPVEVPIPTGDLAEGRYALCLSFVSIDGGSRMKFVKPLAVIAPAPLPALEPVRRTGIGANGRFLVNGEPFLSVYYYHPPLDLAGMKNLRDLYGATTTPVWGGVDDLCTLTERAWQAGLYTSAVLFDSSIFDYNTQKWKDGPLTEAVNRLKNHPGLLCWELFDEPDAQNVSPAEVKRVYDVIRQLDPNHVIWVNFCNINKFAEYTGTSDVASYDHYPLPLRGLGPIREHNRAIQAAFLGKPLLSVLQTYAAAGDGMPSPAQLRAQVYLNLCEGMTLFHYFAWSQGAPESSLATSPELRSFTRLLNHELHALAPFLASTNCIPATAKGEGSEELVWLAKQVGEFVELVVVNPEPTPVTQWRLALDDRKITSAELRFDLMRAVKVRRGALTGSLPPYGVGIYRLRVAR